jgi:uncharacterized protein YjgD (DUF1641 family)
MYDTAVAELENHSVELDLEVMKLFIIKLLKNVPTFINMVSMIESMTDLAKDAGPMVNEMIIDFTKKLHEFENKGYFEFFREGGKVIDNVVTNFTTEDVNHLADNIVTILLTIKNLTQPEVLTGINNAVKVFNKMDVGEIPDYSFWKLLREFRSPEMRKGMTFIVMFMKNLANFNEPNSET